MADILLTETNEWTCPSCGSENQTIYPDETVQCTWCLEEHNTIVKVCFRILEDEVIAIFPELIADGEGNFTSYMKIGQHSACDPSLINELKPAKQEEYHDLLKELKMIGYVLKVI